MTTGGAQPLGNEPIRNNTTSSEVARTERITLRRLVDDDLDFLAEMLGDPEVMRYWPEPLDRAGAEAWLRRQQRRYEEFGCGYWLIIGNESKQPVGQAGVLINEEEYPGEAFLGYLTHRPFWRRGYALEAASMCLNYIFEALDKPTAYSLVRPVNEPSIALSHRLGMRPLRTVQFHGYEHVLFAIDRPNP